jgi:hypothetical protein
VVAKERCRITCSEMQEGACPGNLRTALAWTPGPPNVVDQLPTSATFLTTPPHEDDGSTNQQEYSNDDDTTPHDMTPLEYWIIRTTI